jgi:hypothetical protein
VSRVRLPSSFGLGAKVALGLASLLMIGLALAQLLLPSLATRQVRDTVARYGEVRSVSVHSFPAITLLWGEADSLDLTVGRMRLDSEQADGLLAGARDVGDLRASIGSLDESSLWLRNLHLVKHGPSLSGNAILTAAALRAVLPPGSEVRLLGSRRGTFEVRVTQEMLGLRGSQDMVVAARGGKLVAEPEGVPFAPLLATTLYSSPQLDFSGVAAREAMDAGGARAYELHLRASFT